MTPIALIWCAPISHLICVQCKQFTSRTHEKRQTHSFIHSNKNANEKQNQEHLKLAPRKNVFFLNIFSVFCLFIFYFYFGKYIVMSKRIKVYCLLLLT